MTNRELDRLLKSMAPPPRDAAYWQTFPEDVARRLPARPAVPPPASGRAVAPWLPRLGLAVVGVLVGGLVLWLAFGPGRGCDSTRRLLERSYREASVLFPCQLQSVVLESGQVRLELSEAPEGSPSTPLYVRLRGGSECAVAVTSSGQQVHLFGRTFEVLADGRGHIMLLGPDSVWVAGQDATIGTWRFDAGWLGDRL